MCRPDTHVRDVLTAVSTVSGVVPCNYALNEGQAKIDEMSLIFPESPEVPSYLVCSALALACLMVQSCAVILHAWDILKCSVYSLQRTVL